MPKAKEKIKKADQAMPTDDAQSQLTQFGLTEEDETNLLQQVESEYQLAWWFIKPRWNEWMLRLKLYNNQRRNKDAVGDSLMFATHQTLLAAFYDDKLQVVFSPREKGDEEVAEALTDVAEFDSEQMHKNEMDFIWDWDTLFYGTGLVLFMEFDRNLMMPIPENIDPATFLRDPRGRRVNGDLRGRGKLRFCGREVRMTRWEMEEAGVYKDFKDLEPTVVNLQSLYDEAERLRQVAMGYSNISQFKQLMGVNQDFLLLEWFTYFVPKGETKAKLLFLTLGNTRKKIVRMETIEDKKIPIIERRIYPIANAYDGASVMDFTEDKQRARAVVQNAALKVVEAGVHSKYVYDQTRITNKHDLDEAQNKYIGIDGNPINSIILAPKDQVHQDVTFILNALSGGAERALATPELAQGIVNDEQRTATEITDVSKRITSRYSLTAKIFGWSEKEFWQRWYSLYKKHFKDGIDKKVVRIVGILGAKWRPLTRENLITDTDPDVEVKSKSLSDAERFNRLNTFQSFLNNVASDPNANKRGMEKYYGKLIGLKKDEIDYFLPSLPEELRAREENLMLEKEQLVNVLPTDDHNIHIAEHNKVEDNAQKIAHINAHLRALALQRARPDLFGGNIPPSGMNPAPQVAGAQKVQKPVTTSDVTAQGSANTK